MHSCIALLQCGGEWCVSRCCVLPLGEGSRYPFNRRPGRPHGRYGRYSKEENLQPYRNRNPLSEASYTLDVKLNLAPFGLCVVV